MELKLTKEQVGDLQQALAGQTSGMSMFDLALTDWLTMHAAQTKLEAENLALRAWVYCEYCRDRLERGVCLHCSDDPDW